MPPALNRVEEASQLLLQASLLLRDDPFSAPARKKLIEGSRGECVIINAILYEHWIDLKNFEPFCTIDYRLYSCIQGFAFLNLPNTFTQYIVL